MSPDERPKRNLSAYYYDFEPTGEDAIDAILEAVARAGKAYHSTEDWSDEPYGGGPSYAEKIQAAAVAGAQAIREAQAATREECARIADANASVEGIGQKIAAEIRQLKDSTDG